MPQVGAFILGGLYTVGTAVAATAGISLAGSFALAIGVGAATFAVVGYGIKRSLSLQDPGDFARDSSFQVAVRGTQEPRNIVYGQAKVGGVIAYANSAGTDQRELYMAVAHAGHEIDSFVGWFIDDKYVPVADVDTGGDGSVDSDTGSHGLDDISGTPVCYLRGHLGTSSQTVDAFLTAAFAEWDSSHTGLGCAYTVLRADLLDPASFPTAPEKWDGGPPQNVSALVKGKKVYDPRADGTFVGATYGAGSGTQRLATPSTWAWSANPALCLADYLIDADLGANWASARIDYDSVAVAAAACDVLVAIPTATTQKRFTCNGILTTADDCLSNIEALCTAGVKLRYYKGQWHIFADVWVAPALALTKEDLIGEFSFRAEPERDDRYNTVKGSYFDPARNYELSPFIEVTSSLKSARDNNRELVKELRLPFTNNEYEAQRLAFRALGQAAETGICTFPTFYQSTNGRIGDTATATLDELGWAPESFRIVGFTHVDFQGNGLRLKEDDSAAYDDPAEGDYGTRSAADVITFPKIRPAQVDTIFIGQDAVSELYSATAAGPITLTITAPASDVIGIVLDTSLTSESWTNPLTAVSHTSLFEITASFDATATGLLGGETITVGPRRDSSGSASIISAQAQEITPGVSKVSTTVVGTPGSQASGTYNVGFSARIQSAGATTATVTFTNVSLRIKKKQR